MGRMEYEEISRIKKWVWNLVRVQTKDDSSSLRKTKKIDNPAYLNPYARYIWSSKPTSGHISRQSYNSKSYMHPYVHSNTIYNSQDIERT